MKTFVTKLLLQKEVLDQMKSVSVTYKNKKVVSIQISKYMLMYKSTYIILVYIGIKEIIER